MYMMDISDLLGFFIIFEVFLITYKFFLLLLQCLCVAPFVCHHTLLSALNWNTCIYGKFDPFHYTSETCKRILLSALMCYRNKICCGQHCIYFKIIWWFQNLRIQKACAYTVVGKSSSEGTAIHSNIWDRTDSITSKVTVLGAHSIPTAVTLYTLNLPKKTTGSASLFPQSCVENLNSWSSKIKTKHIPERCHIPTNITRQDWQ